MTATNTSSLSEKEAQLHIEKMGVIMLNFTEKLANCKEYTGIISDDSDMREKRVSDIKQVFKELNIVENKLKQSCTFILS